MYTREIYTHSSNARTTSKAAAATAAKHTGRRPQHDNIERAMNALSERCRRCRYRHRRCRHSVVRLLRSLGELVCFVCDGGGGDGDGNVGVCTVALHRAGKHTLEYCAIGIARICTCTLYCTLCMSNHIHTSTCIHAYIPSIVLNAGA